MTGIAKKELSPAEHPRPQRLLSMGGREVASPLPSLGHEPHADRLGPEDEVKGHHWSGRGLVVSVRAFGKEDAECSLEFRLKATQAHVRVDGDRGNRAGRGPGRSLVEVAHDYRLLVQNALSFTSTGFRGSAMRNVSSARL